VELYSVHKAGDLREVYGFECHCPQSQIRAANIADVCRFLTLPHTGDALVLMEPSDSKNSDKTVRLEDYRTHGIAVPWAIV
jgi:hypothetical protein